MRRLRAWHGANGWTHRCAACEGRFDGMLYFIRKTQTCVNGHRNLFIRLHGSQYTRRVPRPAARAAGT